MRAAVDVILQVPILPVLRMDKQVESIRIGNFVLFIVGFEGLDFLVGKAP